MQLLYIFFFFNDTATTEIYTLSLHDALPISELPPGEGPPRLAAGRGLAVGARHRDGVGHRGQRVARLSVLRRSEEHTSELQSQSNLVCRLLLEKKKKVVQ